MEQRAPLRMDFEKVLSKLKGINLVISSELPVRSTRPDELRYINRIGSWYFFVSCSSTLFLGGIGCLHKAFVLPLSIVVGNQFVFNNGELLLLYLPLFLMGSIRRKPIINTSGPSLKLYDNIFPINMSYSTPLIKNSFHDRNRLGAAYKSIKKYKREIALHTFKTIWMIYFNHFFYN